MIGRGRLSGHAQAADQRGGEDRPGRRLFLDTPEAVKAAAERLQSETLASSTRIEGFLVEPVFRHTGALEAKVGARTTPCSGR